MLKKTIIFILSLIPLFLVSIIPIDYNYYNILKLPSFAPPKLFYSIAWTIVYIFIALSTTSIIDEYGFKVPKSYKLTLLINYIFNQSYTIVFFVLKNNFLGFVTCLATFISCLFLILETSTLKEKSAKLLIPYALLTLFATILSLAIYIMNI